MTLLGFTGKSFSQLSAVAIKEMQPKVVAVFPSADTLPANLLRMYIRFSGPMKPVGNLEKIKLADENGEEVVGAIFNNAYELWNHEQTQLTLLFDPSRVKTGLKAHKAMGRALMKGEKYSLHIGELENVEGQNTCTFTKTFVVVEADLNPPNTASWDIQMPKAGSRAPLIIRFPEGLDHLSLLQRLKLTDMANEPFAGEVTIAKNETEWQFTPNKGWKEGDLRLHVHGRLEDPSGNNLNGLFDHKQGTLKNAHEVIIESIDINIKE